MSCIASEEDLCDMADKTILITGGAGYIGSHTNALFCERGYDTIILDNLVYGHKECVLGGKFMQGDISDAKLLDKIFTENKIDAVVHFAAFAYVGESVSNPSKYYNNNVANTITLLDAMVRHGVRNFIFSSTCATYGVPPKMPITESTEQKPINPYGASKLMVERVAKDYAAAYGIKFCIFRYFNAAGADPQCRMGEWHDPETHIIPLVLDAAIGRREAISIFGTDYPTKDGTCVRDYIHVADLADAHLRAYEHLASGGDCQFLNLGTMKGISIRELIGVAKKVTGVNFAVKEAGRRAGDPPELIGSMEKARAVLGWTPVHSDIEEIVSHAWAWHKKLYGGLK